LSCQQFSSNSDVWLSTIATLAREYDGEELNRHEEFYDLIPQQNVVKLSDIVFSDEAVFNLKWNGISKKNSH
jgi:hypothetical protein